MSAFAAARLREDPVASAPGRQPDVETPHAAEVRRAYARFDRLVSIAERLLASRAYPEAAACAQIAAREGFTAHPGIFASNRLEAVLERLGLDALPARTDPPRARRHTVHVLTYARRSGGDTRFVWRWIAADPERRHSVVVTKQENTPPPPALAEAVARAGGRLHFLQAPIADVLGQAAELRHLTEGADVVALHLFPDDIVPSIALVAPPPDQRVVFVHHSDHTFWVGRRVSHLFAQLRDTPSFPLERRRGISGADTTLLPIPLARPARPESSKTAAKLSLGQPHDAIVLLSVATSFKFDPIDPPHLLDLIVPVLREHPRAVYLAIGPHPSRAWAEAAAATGGRVVALGPRHDTAAFYAAADVYLDPYPFSSITSLLEAGSHGVPLLGYVPNRPSAVLMSAGAPGLERSMLRAPTPEAYAAVLRELLESASNRTARGEWTRHAIVHDHCAGGWTAHLNRLYRRLATVPPRCADTRAVDVMENGELDQHIHVLVHRLWPQGLGPMIDTYVGPLPYRARLRCLRRLCMVDRGFSWTLLLPPALERPLSGRLHGVRRLLEALGRRVGALR
ncbi:MAG TPA: glycosyltransferase [Vicinamibacterales bacterium]|nr:glycosyltransferase [Vicinamibacterales bacterium]